MSLVHEIALIGSEIDRMYPMSKYTSLRVGGLADILVTPNNLEEFKKLLDLLTRSGEPWVVLGAGSNTVVYDTGIEGVVVSTRKLKNIEITDDHKVYAETGAVLGTILNRTIKAGLTGFEFAAGIPGTVGGGIFMNAGANGGEIKDVLETVWVWLGGEEIAIDRKDLKFEYRKSYLPEGSVITRASFGLRQGNPQEIERSVKEYMDKRNRTQPIKMSNTGSIFKNPPEIPAGKLLDELGFKGLSIGGAKFSEMHANFIVNAGCASASDVLGLIEKAKKAALDKRGITLETEVRVIGKDKVER
ncbi:MAG: UDP-N-acetylenolpyruvoylglucosamine reductase [Candidatus Dadabacteria bacterium RIFCSPHIGHO2_12_FULL_53_21]|nr:MAG: UDP-N-acetylenolpyruvoylglucosamine reductase [Candidatus Dadabacteria bacterium RIFCSPHIGHO2_12_FULL_53_21]